METSVEEQLKAVAGPVRPVNVLLVYPSTGEVALANLGFIIREVVGNCHWL